MVTEHIRGGLKRFAVLVDVYFTLLYFISERTTLRSLYAINRPSVVRCLSVCLSVCLLSVCDVGAPYSGG